MTIYTPDPAILELGDELWDVVAPAKFPSHIQRYRNNRAAAEVGLEALSPDEWQQHFSAFVPLERNLEEPLTLRYHGHQFGQYNPNLGDGRGFLFAQLKDDRGRLMDLATKGSGPTPWSRGGDGKLTLKGGVREVLAAELLEALGVPTSRAFSLFETGEQLYRGDEPSPTRSSVLVRLGWSHVRFGTFQRLARVNDPARMQKYVDYAVRHFYPQLASLEPEERVDRFLDAVCSASATLCAKWMTAGFVHGVLNTDNMVVTGESFDYGPWRFAPTFDPDFTAAYFDHSGLYAFGRQPAAVEWNVGKLADALRLIAPAAPLGASVSAFAERYEAALAEATVQRLGLVPTDPDLDRALATTAWDHLRTTKAPFERFFFDAFAGRYPAALEKLVSAYARSPAAELFDREGPCTMHIDEVESIWGPIARHDDWSLFEAKLVDIRDVATSYAL